MPALEDAMVVLIGSRDPRYSVALHDARLSARMSSPLDPIVGLPSTHRLVVVCDGDVDQRSESVWSSGDTSEAGRLSVRMQWRPRSRYPSALEEMAETVCMTALGRRPCR
jgi:hypothetical protein